MRNHRKKKKRKENNKTVSLRLKNRLGVSN